MLPSVEKNVLLQREEYRRGERRLTLRGTSVGAFSVLLIGHRDPPLPLLVGGTVEAGVLAAVVVVSLAHHVGREGDLAAGATAVAVEFVFRHSADGLREEEEEACFLRLLL